MTNALILAAGRGKRMQELTLARPKCMILINQKPLIEYQIESFLKNNITNIAVVGGYCVEKIKSTNIKKTIINEHWANTNMVYSMLCAQQWLKEADTIISYSDIIYNANAITALSNDAADIVIPYNVNFLPLWQRRFKNPLDDLESFRVDKQGQLSNIGDSPNSLMEIQGQYMGLLKITTAGWEMISKIISKLAADLLKKMEMTKLLNLLIQKKIIIKAIPYTGFWFEIDSPYDLEICEELMGK